MPIRELKFHLFHQQENDMHEEFRNITGFDGLYQIGMFGSVKNIKRNKLLSHCYSSTGYPKVSLCKKGKIFQKSVHRLVAEAFIPNEYNKPQVNHKDGNKSNPSAANLEWVTPSENGIHAYKNNLSKAWSNGYIGKNTPKAKVVFQYSEDGLAKKWDCISDACRKHGFDGGCITKCCQNKYNSHNGFVWSYTNKITMGEVIKKLSYDRRKKIKRIDKNGDIKIYQSISDAVKEGFRNSGIIGACKGQYKTSMGYMWEYV